MKTRIKRRATKPRRAERRTPEQMKPLANKGIEQAIEKAGGQSALAESMKVKQPAVHHWLYVNCPPEWAIEIERKFGVSRKQTRPDLFA